MGAKVLIIATSRKSIDGITSVVTPVGGLPGIVADGENALVLTFDMGNVNRKLGKIYAKV